VKEAKKNLSKSNISTDEGLEHRFIAGLLNFASDAEGNNATFYIMNTSRNRNRWGVTEQALEEALPTLKGVKLGMGEGYRVDRHYPDGKTMDSGVFVSYEKPGTFALGTAKIEDAKTWQMMQAGKLGPVSVVIHSFRDTCSSCGEDLSAKKAPFNEHKCLSKGDAYAKVESFRFKRVDFVDVPAYPQAGLLEMASHAEDRSQSIELLAGVYVSQAPPKNGVTKTKTEEENLSEKLEEKMASLEQINQKLTKDLEAATAKAAAAASTAETLKAQVETMQKEKHDTLVAECLKARSDAGIAGKEDQEKEKLAKLNDETLILLKADASKVASLNQAKEQVSPKLRYSKTNEEPLTASIKEVRSQLGLPERKEAA
jgi:hypothetical protein